ncbi:unnamed protein product, partial [Trichobilharzia regenti]
VFYTRPSVRQPTFDSWFNTSVIYHDTNPNFGDQAKICLPLNLTPEHHLLFRFYHVSCETAATNLTGQKEKTSSYKKPVESSTGYSWIPILGTYGNLNVGTFQLRVTSTIQPGYLKHSTVQVNVFSLFQKKVIVFPISYIGYLVFMFILGGFFFSVFIVLRFQWSICQVIASLDNGQC